MALFRRKKKRTCVLGLDGVPMSLLEDLAGQGVMPKTRTIVSQGRLEPMTVSLPEISSVSWSCFMTGTNPGTHGVFGFVDLKPGQYELRFPSYKDLKAPAIWDRLGARGKRSIVINQPSTYPARRMEGIQISGFVAIDLDRAVFPRPMARRLSNAGYMIDIDTARCRNDHDLLFKQLHQSLEGRRKALDLLWDEEWDYLEIVITGTDRLHHFLWPALKDSSHPRHEACMDYYRAIDGFIFNLYERFSRKCGRTDPSQGFFLLSDHGFTGIEQEVYLNAWLKQEGYLDYAAADPEELADLADGSRAFALDPSRIYLNRKGKFPKGSVRPEEAGALAEEIASGLKQLTCGDKPVVREVFKRDAIYSGPEATEGPDLVVLSHHGFDLKGSVKRTEIFGRSEGLVGMHTYDDALFWSRSGSGRELNIKDVASIVLDSLGE